MKKVVISIKGLQNLDNEESDEIELVTDGEFLAEDGKFVFSYLESELTGLEGTRTTFTVEGDRVILTREGTVTSQMVFEERQKNYFVYRTPFGAFTMGVDTYCITSRLHEDGGDLEIYYFIDMENAQLTKNSFIIHIAPADGGKINNQ